MGVPLTAAREVTGERRSALWRQELTCNERGYARAQRRLDRCEHRRFCGVCVRTWGSYASGLVSALTQGLKLCIRMDRRTTAVRTTLIDSDGCAHCSYVPEVGTAANEPARLSDNIRVITLRLTSAQHGFKRCLRCTECQRRIMPFPICHSHAPAVTNG